MNANIKPLELDGITYTPAMIESLCQPLLDIRDALLTQGQMEHTVAMCHIYALLQHLIKNTSK